VGYRIISIFYLIDEFIKNMQTLFSKYKLNLKAYLVAVKRKSKIFQSKKYFFSQKEVGSEFG